MASRPTRKKPKTDAARTRLALAAGLGTESAGAAEVVEVAVLVARGPIAVVAVMPVTLVRLAIPIQTVLSRGAPYRGATHPLTFGARGLRWPYGERHRRLE
jgi:hypothetical protein